MRPDAIILHISSKKTINSATLPGYLTHGVILDGATVLNIHYSGKLVISANPTAATTFYFGMNMRPVLFNVKLFNVKLNCWLLIGFDTGQCVCPIFYCQCTLILI